jgi:hypothetical protein
MNDGDGVRAFYGRRGRRLLDLDYPWSTEEKVFLRRVSFYADFTINEDRLAVLLNLEKKAKATAVS